MRFKNCQTLNVFDVRWERVSETGGRVSPSLGGTVGVKEVSLVPRGMVMNGFESREYFYTECGYVLVASGAFGEQM